MYDNIFVILRDATWDGVIFVSIFSDQRLSHAYANAVMHTKILFCIFEHFLRVLL